MASAKRDTEETYGGWLETATSKSAASVLQSLAAMEVGAGSVDPSIAPLFVVLKAASEVVNRAVRHEKDLKEMLAICAVITGRLLANVQADGDSSRSLDVSSLKECLELLKEVAEYYSRTVVSVRIISSLLHGDRILDLRARIARLVSTMGSVAVVAIGGEDQCTPVSTANQRRTWCNGPMLSNNSLHMFTLFCI